MQVSLYVIQEFLNQKKIAVAGVSSNDKKTGSLLFYELEIRGYEVFPINPNLEQYKGKKCYKNISELPDNVNSVITCTKPAETEKIVEEISKKGIKHLWMQIGSQSEKAIKIAEENNLSFVSKKCIYMFLEPVKGPHKFHKFLSRLFGTYPK